MPKEINKETMRGAGLPLLVAFALFLAAFLAKGALNDPPPVPARVAAGAFDAHRAALRLARILGDERPHPVDSPANDAVRGRLIEEIKALGLAPAVRDDFTCRGSARWGGVSCARVRNVLFRFGPPGGNAVLIAAHYDSVPAGPGAGDDGVGMATALEIAAVLKARALSRPVIVLVTDGEEAGLIGAASFVRGDPWAKDVGAVVNFEARGVSGKALMFETASPNGRSVDAYRGVPVPAANSLATAIYKMMPNDTDMSEFLALGGDALNFAITGGAQFYHTPHDRLAALDRRSLSHMGASGLAAVERLLTQPSDMRRPEVAFTDVLGLKLLVFPPAFGLGAVALAGLLALVIFIRVGGGAPMRALAMPPLAFGAGGVLAFAVAQLLGVVRAGELYWFAHPAATRAALYAASLAGVFAVFALLGPHVRRERLAASSWLWFSALAAAAYVVAPGSVGVFAPPAAVFAFAAAISLAAPRTFLVLTALAAAAALAVFAPLLDLAESGLSLGSGAPIATLGGVLFTLAAALARPSAPMRRAALGAPFAAAGVAGLAALAAPAYSPAAPQPVNVTHRVDAASGESHFVLPTAPHLAWAGRVAKFERRILPGTDGPALVAAAPNHGAAPVEIEILSSLAEGDGRRVRLRIAAMGADSVRIRAPVDAGLVRLVAGGADIRIKAAGGGFVRCTGRACASFECEAIVGQMPAEWTFDGLVYGLDASGAPLVAARPSDQTPIQDGDVRRITSRLKI